MVHCPSCGAGLRFDIATQSAACDYCNNRFDPKKITDSTYDDAKTQKTFDSYAYICPSCGAEVDTTDKNDAVGFCPYCGGASMIFDKMRRDWAPDKIIPFQITKEQCKELYVAEVKKHPFVSSKFRDPALIESFRGIYMPYCDFEGVLDDPVLLKAHGREYDEGNYHYRTDYYDLRGMAHYKVTGGTSHDASVAFDDHISERLAPFDRRNERGFRPVYLSGFYAEAGDISMNEYGPVLWDKMLPVVLNKMESDPQVQKSVPNDHLKIDDSRTDNNVPMKIVSGGRRLYPVWFMSYRRGNKITYAAVNGQTGKVAADLPLSPLKILLTALICSAAIFGLLFLLMHFLPTLPAVTTLGVCTMLGLTGMYMLQHFYINTVGGTLGQAELKTKLPVFFVVLSLAATVGLILMTTDGTYEQTRHFFGVAMTAVSVVLLLFKFYLPQAKLTGMIKKIELKDASMQTNGILVEAKRFNIPNTLVRVILYVFFLAMIWIVYLGTMGSVGCYSLAAVEGAGLFVLALMHILFQTRIASRRLPQFNKKGAAYDEN